MPSEAQTPNRTSRKSSHYPFHVSRMRLLFGIVWCVVIAVCSLGIPFDTAEIPSEPLVLQIR